MKSQLSPTWILFASGNSVKVELSLYDPAAERSRPIEAYMVSDVGTDLARSASRAAEAVYAIAHTAKIAPPPTVVGYDLQGLGNGSHIAGHSSGLALALALAKKFWQDLDPGPIAATGEIAGSSNGGPLNKIAEIESKGQTVISLLPEGGYFFYPKGNDSELSKTLKQSLRKKGIKAMAVESVAEALASFIPAIADQSALKPELTASITLPEAGRRPALLLFITLAMVAVIAVAGLFYASQKPRPKPTTPTSPTTTAKTVEQPSVDQSFPEITLTSTPGLAGRLARRTKARLKDFIDSNKNLQKKLGSVDGRVEIIEIRERWNPETDSLSSTVTAAFHGQATLKNGNLNKIDLEPITVSSNGSMRQQLSNAATLMVDRIAKAIQGDENVKTWKKPARIKHKTQTSKGFE